MNEEKRCSRCSQDKPLGEFRKRKAGKNGLDAWCIICYSKYRLDYERSPKGKEKKKAAYLRRRDRALRTNTNGQLKRKYGIDLLEYERMFTLQKGKCLICERTTKRRLAVDHDHKTGAVRGLLCFLCNQGIGYFKDNPSFLNKAANYLKGNITI